MKRIGWMMVLLLVVLLPAPAAAQDKAITNQWPVCKPGGSPAAKGTPPADVHIFKSPMMSQKKPASKNDVEWILCRLEAGVDSYRTTSGVLYDVVSNQPYLPIGWDAGPPPLQKGDKGEPGKSILAQALTLAQGPCTTSVNGVFGAAFKDAEGTLTYACSGASGRDGINGINGINGRDALLPPTSKKEGARFGCGGKCKVTLAGIGTAAVIGGICAAKEKGCMSQTTIIDRR